MASSLSQQPSSFTALAPSPGGPHTLVRAADVVPVARGESFDACWFVRVVLVADTDAHVRSVRLILDDRAIRRIVLHTVWTAWQELPLLAAYVPARPCAPGEMDAAAAALAGVILTSLRHDAAACLTALGTPLGSLPERAPGRQERAALRYNRDAARAWQWASTPRRAAGPAGTRVTTSDRDLPGASR